MPSSAPPRNSSYRPCRGRPAGRGGDLHPPVRRRGGAPRGGAGAGRRGGHGAGSAPTGSSSCGRSRRDTPVGRFLESRGPGMHHIAYLVDDIRASLREAAAAGAELIDTEPRVGLFGLRGGVHPSRQRCRGAGRVRPDTEETVMASDVTRVEIGFDGGLIVITKIAAKEWDALEGTLKAGKGVAQFSGDDDSTYLIDVSKVSYVKHESARRAGRLLTGRCGAAASRGSTGSCGLHPGRRPRPPVGRDRAAVGPPGARGRDGVGHARGELCGQERRSPGAPARPRERAARPRPGVVVVPLEPRRDVDGRRDRARGRPAAAGAALRRHGRGDGVRAASMRACTTPATSWPAWRSARSPAPWQRRSDGGRRGCPGGTAEQRQVDALQRACGRRRGGRPAHVLDHRDRARSGRRARPAARRARRGRELALGQDRPRDARGG